MVSVLVHELEFELINILDIELEWQEKELQFKEIHMNPAKQQIGQECKLSIL